jgi:hypothetical protein
MRTRPSHPSPNRRIITCVREFVELAKAGERDPDLLCEGAIEKLRGHLYGD